MDSRSLAFADEVLSSTAGEGVDVVLNSLAGEAIDKNLSIVRARGRIVEIGKIDIYKNRKIGMRPLRSNISLFCLDMNSAVQRWPDLAQSLLREVMALFESRDLHPLPHRVFPAARVADAFRYMAQAKHVGKLIVSVQDRNGLEIEREPRSLVIDPDASYLISGGLGGLGLAVADRLARHGARHLALVGRSDPSPSAQAAVDALRRRGVEVMTFRSDIADRERTQRVIADVQRRMGPLRGIMHAAMVLDDAPIERLTEERMWKAMAPKMLGAWNLHALTLDAPLDFFVLFSSMSAVIGNPGQANYVAGNAFLDTLAYYRRAQGRPALTVDWGMVGEVGHLANIPEAADRLGRFGIRPMPVSETLDALDELIPSNAVQVAVVEVEWKDLLRLTASRTLARFAGVLGETDGEDGRSKTSSRVREILEADAATLPPLLETYIRDHLARAMGASPARIDVQQSLVSLGLDSLIAVEVRNRINADLGMNVPLAKFMQGASVNSLAAYIAERLLQGDRSERAKPQRADAAAESEIAASSRSAAEPSDHTGGPTDARAPGRSLVADTSSRHDPFPLTDVQRAYWLGRSSFFELGKVACHVYLEFDITNLDREQVQAAWRTLVERHDMLRVVIRDDGLQQILPDVPKYVIEHRNLRGVADAQQLVDAIRERMSHQVLPAGRWPLFELRTSQLDRQTLLHMSLDLLAIDFWSIQLLLDEWLRLSLDPGLWLAPLGVSFRDYVLAAAARRDSPGYRRAEEYWRQRLGTLAPPPKLPLARSPSAVTRQRFIRRQAVLDGALWQRLRTEADAPA